MRDMIGKARISTVVLMGIMLMAGLACGESAAEGSISNRTSTDIISLTIEGNRSGEWEGILTGKDLPGFKGNGIIEWADSRFSPQLNSAFGNTLSDLQIYPYLFTDTESAKRAMGLFIDTIGSYAENVISSVIDVNGMNATLIYGGYPDGWFSAHAYQQLGNSVVQVVVTPQRGVSIFNEQIINAVREVFTAIKW
jgi:hypothetical protein